MSSPSEAKIKVTRNGPYVVLGGVPLFSMIIKCDDEQTPARWIFGERIATPEAYSLCRCGHSQTKPFCDGTHEKINFDGTEGYDNVPYEKMAKTLEGPNLKLKDAEILCASARFCHRGGDIWDQIHHCDNPKVKENVIKNAFDCPSGRLVLYDESVGKTLEPALEKSVGIIEDPAMGVSGPYWIRGGIPIYSADGKLYEMRNRITLCRCGKSTIKPFCDSSHYPEEDREVK